MVAKEETTLLKRLLCFSSPKFFKNVSVSCLQSNLPLDALKLEACGLLCAVVYHVWPKDRAKYPGFTDMSKISLKLVSSGPKRRPMWRNRDSGIRVIFACEIWNPGLWIPEYSSRNPLENQESKFHWKRIRNPGLPWIPLHGAKKQSFQNRGISCTEVGIVWSLELWNQQCVRRTLIVIFPVCYCLTPRLPPSGVMTFKRSIALSLS